MIGKKQILDRLDKVELKTFDQGCRMEDHAYSIQELRYDVKYLTKVVQLLLNELNVEYDSNPRLKEVTDVEKSTTKNCKGSKCQK